MPRVFVTIAVDYPDSYDHSDAFQDLGILVEVNLKECLAARVAETYSNMGAISEHDDDHSNTSMA